MKKHLLFSIMTTVCIALLFAGCNKWEAPEFNAPVYTGPAANHTIADLKLLHPSLGSGAQDPVPSDEPFIIKAVVVSSDQGGNCYKYMTVQDETGGIEISIDRTGLYNDYPVGQIVYIDCRGLIVGDYHNKYQLGCKYKSSVGRINQQALKKHIFKDGLPEPNHTFLANPINITGAGQLSAENVNCLVKIDGCTFDSKYNGQPLATNDMTLDREVYINGATVIVRTSNYANFRSITIDASKKYCLYGVLSIYNSEYQLTLRTKEDIQMAHNEEEILVNSLTFNESSLSTDWTVYPANTWTFFSNNTNGKFVYHDKATTNCDDWLISPEITLNDIQKVTLKLEHQNTVTSQPDYYQVYYSTTYNGGAFNESDWTAFNPNINNFPTIFGFSNGLDVSAIGSNKFRIALRYHKYGSADGSRWAVKALNFYQTR